MHGVFWPEPLVPGECHGGGALHRGHQAYLPLYSFIFAPHEKATGLHLAVRCPGGCAACAAVEALQSSALQELVLLPHAGTQRLAGCAPASAFLSAGADGPTGVHCLQYTDQLCSASGQAVPQASPQRHILSHRDDLSTSGYRVGLVCVLGSLAGKKFSSEDLSLILYV